MALKATIAKTDYEALPEALRTMYVAQGDKFVLDVEGGIASPAELTEARTKLNEFRENNRTMHGELQELRPLKERFKDIDPEEVKRLKKIEDDMKIKGIKPDQIGEFIKTEIEKATKPLVDKLAAEETARVTAQRVADQARFKELVTEPATKAGVTSKSVRHVLRDAGDLFELNDTKDGLRPKTGVTHPSPEAWLESLAKTDDYLFEQSTGGGANGGAARGIGRTGARELVNPTSEEMGHHMDDIASGKVVVVRR